jgi:hypothetical protein
MTLTRMDAHRALFVRRRLANWQALLQLQAWRVRLFFGTRLKLTEQGCAFHLPEQRANISLNIRQDRKPLDHLLGHELAHLVEAPTNRVFDDLLEAYVPKEHRDGWQTAFNDAQNVTIEHWLRVFYALQQQPYPPYREPSHNGHRPGPGIIRS